MKQALLDMLELPRRIARSGVALETCRHAGHFVEADPGCTLCRSRIECEWLYHADEYSALRERPQAEVLDALRFAAAYVDAHVTLTRHRRRGCGCEICRWLSEVNGLLDGIDHGA